MIYCAFRLLEKASLSFLNLLSNFGICCCEKCQPKAAWGRNGVFGLHCYVPDSIAEGSGQELQQGLKQGSREYTAEWLSFCFCSAGFFRQPKTTSPGTALFRCPPPRLSLVCEDAKSKQPSVDLEASSPETVSGNSHWPLRTRRGTRLLILPLGLGHFAMAS